MNVGVDEARQERFAPAVNDLGVSGNADLSSDRRNLAVLDNDRTRWDDFFAIEYPGVPNRLGSGLL
jgi:hypothetical protein